MTMKKYLLDILTGVLLLGLTACESEEQVAEMNMQPLRVRAEMATSGFTRTTPNVEDGFSVGYFSTGDKGGFFSEGGNVGNNPFENEKMTFTLTTDSEGNVGGYFEAANGVEADINRMGKTLIYYPYSANEHGRQTLRKADNGEVIDLLYSTTIGDVNAGSYVATFHHTFSMLIIEGGQGFEKLKANNPEITVTMDKPLTTVEFQRVTQPGETNYDIGYKVVFEGSDKPEDATFKGHYNENDGKYYIIIPCDGGVTKIKSINAKDDSGRMHRIKWQYKSEWGVTTATNYETKYPVTLALDEMVPVINIHDITPWDANKELNTTEQNGIGSIDDFRSWMEEYNKGTAANEDELQKYGNKVEVVNGSVTEYYWHFILTTDIDLSGLSEASYFIEKLSDHLDGCGHTLSGIKLKEGDNAALIKEINGKHAYVENLIVDGLTVNTTGTTDPVGAVATTFTQGTIENCIFRNVEIDASSPAGIIAGTITANATLSNCTATGSIFATNTVNRLIGQGTLTPEQQKGCDSSNVMFGEK